MFKPVSWQSHAEYRTNFKNLKAKMDSSGRLDLCDYMGIRTKLLSLNLDSVGEYVERYYSLAGRPAINQAQILRSFILFAFLLNVTPARLSLTKWVREVLPGSDAFIALIGCSCKEDLPPLGSYYDFMNRFWLGDRSLFARNALLPAGKNSKPKKKLGSDGKLVSEEKEDRETPTREAANLILSGKAPAPNPEAALQDILTLAAVIPSVNAGLINAEGLTLSGDGTALHAHASPYGRRTTTCDNPECPFHSSCPRHYSDPDAEWSWDCGQNDWFFGHSLYMLCCRNSDLKVELPLTFKLTNAKRHDSLNFLYAIDDFGRHCLGLSPENICLDSAHDNMPTYELLEHWGINALIDINGRSKHSPSAPDDISFDKDAIPHCRGGFAMTPWGYESGRNAHKYRCPLKCGRMDSCPHEKECSPGKFGRTVYVKNKSDLRFFPRIPRGTEEYRKIYSERTACERLNDRVLNDYFLQSMMVRGRDHLSFWSMVICICIHLDARLKTETLSAA